MTMTEIRPLLESGQWFSHLPPALRDALLGEARLLQLEPGQRLFRRGEPPCGLYAVLEGMMRVGAVSRDGKEALLTLVEPPYWFGEISLFDGQPRTHDAYAEGSTRLLQVPQAALLALLEREPGHWRDFALLMMAEGYGETGPRRVLHLAQEQLALMLGLSRQTTNQILKDLEARGALRLTYGEIEITDLGTLRQAAGVA